MFKMLVVEDLTVKVVVVKGGSDNWSGDSLEPQKIKYFHQPSLIWNEPLDKSMRTASLVLR